jgi:hypothetical protein
MHGVIVAPCDGATCHVLPIYMISKLPLIYLRKFWGFQVNILYCVITLGNTLMICQIPHCTLLMPNTKCASLFKLT